MKRYVILIAICLSVLFAGCGSDDLNAALSSGNYYAVGDYEEMLTPYLWLDLDDNTFALGPGSVVSYAEHGSFEINGRELIATSQSTTYVFEIKDNKTLVLTDNGDVDYFKLPENAEFIFSKDLR